MRHISISAARAIAREEGTRSEIPRFYRENERSIVVSRSIYDTDETVGRIRSRLMRRTDDFGHGMAHSELVALDAGTVVAIELGIDCPELSVLIAAAHTAGLLHDIRRKEPEHAAKSAEEAIRILEEYGVPEADRRIIVTAIRNHEAFKDETPVDDPAAKLISDALYDADKFRWGPDNFVTTLWDMLEYAHIDVERMLAGYPRSIEGIKRIKGTFRTRTGRAYGPEFIDLGIMVGEKIYQRLMDYCGDDA